MTSLQIDNPWAEESLRNTRKRWLAYALLFSVALHISAALIFVIASGIKMGGESGNNYIFQDLTLSPSISTSVKTAVIPPEPHPIMTPPATSAAEVTNTLEQDSASEQRSESSDSSGKMSALMSTPLGLGMVHGFFSGLADGRTLRDDVREYYFEMVGKINREWWDKAGQLKESLRHDGIFELLIQRDGSIVSIRVMQGTGSSDADRLLTEIIKKASPLPPLPSTYGLDMFRAPLRIKAPSFLFR